MPLSRPWQPLLCSGTVLVVLLASADVTVANGTAAGLVVGNADFSKALWGTVGGINFGMSTESTVTIGNQLSPVGESTVAIRAEAGSVGFIESNAHFVKYFNLEARPVMMDDFPRSPWRCCRRAGREVAGLEEHARVLLRTGVSSVQQCLAGSTCRQRLSRLYALDGQATRLCKVVCGGCWTQIMGPNQQVSFANPSGSQVPIPGFAAARGRACKARHHH